MAMHTPLPLPPADAARPQRGFALLELLVAMLLATLLAVWAASAIVDRINDAAAEGTAVWMLAAKQGVRDYLLKYAAQLRTAQSANELAMHGYANWKSPSLQELREDGLLSAGFPEAQGRGPDLVIQVLRDPACTESSCRIEALIHTDRPLMRHGSGLPDEQMVAHWLLATRGQGGTVHTSKPHRVEGASFGFANPPDIDGARLSPGSVALAVTSEELSTAQFLRVGDARDPLFQGSLSVKGDIQGEGSLAVHQHLSIGAQGQFGRSCEPDGKIAREQGGGLVVCDAGVWKWASGRGGGGYSTNSMRGCGLDTRNPITNACTCPPYFQAVRISESGSMMDPAGVTRGYLCVP